MKRSANAQISLEMQDVAYAYPGQAGWAIHHINFKLFGGQKVAIVGRNGSGKSTLLMVAAGLLRPTHGTLFVNNQPVTFDLQGALALRRLVAAVFMNCDDQIMDAHFDSRNASPDFPNPLDTYTDAWLKDETYRQRIERVNELRRVVNAMMRPRHALSLGEQAKAALQTAFQLGAGIFVVDHTLDCLDQFARNDLLNTLDAFAGRGGLVLLSTHNVSAVQSWATLLLVMAGHTIAMMAPPECIFGDSFLRRIVVGREAPLEPNWQA
ncbi:MAG: ATP-binding cassette domain-containing protein [Anaerolineae bacterium]|nr:ATP-binding cassette domain-containing protein [Candidatus Roseilinea sp.]MDW8451809.1 ATP-binding cassette domain-containing protein [Anaerolineae bacterium]